MVTSVVASSGNAVATFRSLGRGDVALHLQESLLDLATWQPPGCEVQAFLIGLHRLIGATFLSKDATLNPIPQGVVEWPRAAWRELPRANLRLSSTHIDFRSGCLRPLGNKPANTCCSDILHTNTQTQYLESMDRGK